MCVSELPYGGGRLTVPKTSTHFGFQDLCDRPEAGWGTVLDPLCHGLLQNGRAVKSSEKHPEHSVLFTQDVLSVFASSWFCKGDHTASP